MLRGDRILVQPKGLEPQLYRYRLGEKPQAERLPSSVIDRAMSEQLQAYLQTATESLLADSTADREREPAAQSSPVAAATDPETPPVVPIKSVVATEGINRR